jgi:hypothetical protein
VTRTAYASILCTSVGLSDLTLLIASCTVRPFRVSVLVGSGAEGLCTIFFAMCATLEKEPWRSSSGGVIVCAVSAVGGEMGSVRCEMEC